MIDSYSQALLLDKRYLDLSVVLLFFSSMLTVYM